MSCLLARERRAERLLVGFDGFPRYRDGHSEGRWLFWLPKSGRDSGKESGTADASLRLSVMRDGVFLSPVPGLVILRIAKEKPNEDCIFHFGVS